MICKSCGKEIADWNYSCPNCGAKVDDDKATSTSTSSTKVDEGVREEYHKTTRPNYFVSDDEFEIARAKWTIVPFIVLWLLYFVALYFGYRRGANITNANKEIVNFLFLAACIFSIIICIVSICIFLLRRELIITNKKVYGRIGLIGTEQFIIPIKKINYISVRYTIIDRILNSATFHIVPGTVFGIWFGFISNAKHFRAELEKQMYDAE